jgi:hypothetical protein
MDMYLGIFYFILLLFIFSVGEVEEYEEKASDGNKA